MFSVRQALHNKKFYIFKNGVIFSDAPFNTRAQAKAVIAKLSK